MVVALSSEAVSSFGKEASAESSRLGIFSLRSFAKSPGVARLSTPSGREERSSLSKEKGRSKR